MGERLLTTQSACLARGYPSMGDEDIFAHSSPVTERPSKSAAARQWFSSVGSMFTKCVPINQIRERFSRTRERTNSNLTLDDDGADEVYHQSPDMNSTTSTGSNAPSHEGFRPPPLPDKSATLVVPGDDEWAESLALRASYEIDRVREDTRRRSKTLPNAPSPGD